MKKFLLLYMTSVSAEDQMKASPEDMQKGMEPWLAWFKKLGDAVVDQGNPLGMGMHFTKSGSSKSDAHVAGYSIVQAESMDKVKEMLVDHPQYMAPDGSVEVLEVLPMM